MRGLNGRIVLVAGGAGGIGTATSRRLAEEGASVMVADLNDAEAESVAAAIRDAGGTAEAMPIDLRDEGSVVAAIDATVSRFGGLDVLHANAADLSPDTIGNDTDAASIPLDAFDRTLAVNLRGHLLCARHAIPRLLEKDGGALVFTSSAAAFAGEPERPAYAMAKSGLGGLVRHIASRWGKQNIRANAVAPGLVLTDTIRESLDPAFRDMALGVTRSARLGTPSDIAAMVAFLASDDASWITGQVISVDGGAVLR
jgi:NAD(P)-dependent dehydrogenase (short-subunit alcohol dehydrogenase family)